MTDLLYTKNDLDIALLKQKDDHFEQALGRIESRLDYVAGDIKSTQAAQFAWIMGSILGIYGLIAGTCLAKVTGLL